MNEKQQDDQKPQRSKEQNQKNPLEERIKPLLERFRVAPANGDAADKAFFDSLDDL